MKRLTQTQLGNLVDVLVAYSSDKVGEMTWDQGRWVRLMYSTMIQAIVDYNHGNAEDRQDAKLYFESSEYFKHCEMCAIDDELMESIILRVDDILDKIGDYDASDEKDDL